MFDKFFERFRSVDEPAAVHKVCELSDLSRKGARRMLARFDPERHEEVAHLLSLQTDDNLFHDPIEDMPEYFETLKWADTETDAELCDVDRGMGFCHLYWRTKKRILLEDHNIEWFDLSDMNPMAFFD